MEGSVNDLAKYRFEKALKNLALAKELFDNQEDFVIAEVRDGRENA